MNVVYLKDEYDLEEYRKIGRHTFIDEMCGKNQCTCMATVEIISAGFHTEGGHSLSDEDHLGFLHSRLETFQLLKASITQSISIS